LFAIRAKIHDNKRMSEKILCLQDHFLIAMPGLGDLNFAHAVVYICAHNEDGCMGMVINHRLSDIKLGEVLQQMNIKVEQPTVNDQIVYLGGPVQTDRGFILHRTGKEWQSTLVVSDKIAITSSQDVLYAIAKGEGPKDALVVLGYSGWNPGQVEQEVIDNMWLTVPAEANILFNTPSEIRWKASAAILGVDLDSLSDEVGHA
jgi:putative transcriptional regulator